MSSAAVVVLIDVSQSMGQKSFEPSGVKTDTMKPVSSLFSKVKEIAHRIIFERLFFKQKDEVSIVLFGAKDVQILSGFESANTAMISSLEAVDEENFGKNAVQNKIVDGLQTSIRLFSTNTGKNELRRIFVLTNPLNELKLDSTAVSEVVSDCSKLNINIDVITFFVSHGIKNEDSESQPVFLPEQQKNYDSFLSFCERIQANTVNYDDQSLNSFLSSRKEVSQTTTFRGNLEISDSLSIPVYCYLKAQQVKFPSLKHISTLAGENGSAVSKAERVSTLILVDDNETEVDPVDTIKGYKFGKTLVPFGKMDESVIKNSEQRTMKLIGFTRKSNCKIESFLGSTYLVCAAFDAKANDGYNARLRENYAISALARACATTDSVCICRYVRCANANPRLVALVPFVKADYECFLMHYLPFAEDVREYVFPMIASSEHFQPNEKLQTIADDLIDKMMLPNDFSLRDITNPTLRLFYSNVSDRICLNSKRKRENEDELRSRQNNLKKIKGDDRTFQILSAPADILHNVESTLIEFGNLCPIEVVAAPNSSTRLNLSDRSAELVFQGLQVDQNISIQINMDHNTHVGTANPCSDYEGLLSVRNEDHVARANTELSNIITTFFRLSAETTKTTSDPAISDLYQNKALDCLKSLRNGCVRENEFAFFNSFLHTLKNSFRDASSSLKTGNISLITSDECVSCLVTHIEAVQFLDLSDSRPVAPISSEDISSDIFNLVE